MVTLDRKKLDRFLTAQDLTLSEFAKQCGISRQSIYNMFTGKSVFSVAYEKVLNYLNIEYDELLAKPSTMDSILTGAPEGIKKALLLLQQFAEGRSADLFLIGSRARKKAGIRADWDFAIFFPKPGQAKGFSQLKGELIDMAFPHRIDIVVLNDAPSWFLQSAFEGIVRITGTSDPDIIFKKDRYKGAA